MAGSAVGRPHYGDLLVFKLPKERLILGPLQVEAMIDQDTTISRQLSLWDRRGSRVIRGNLLVIPIDESLLYVEPVYLRAEENDIPQLKRIIVSDGETLAMEPTLEEALRVVFGAVRGDRASRRRRKRCRASTWTKPAAASTRLSRRSAAATGRLSAVRCRSFASS